MDLIISKLGVASFLKARLNNNFPSDKDLTLHLAVNNPSVVHSSTVEIFTEADGGGYNPITLVCGNWIVDSTPLRTIRYPLCRFDFSSALTDNASIYWYYLTDSEGTLIWSFKLPSAFTPSDDNLFIGVIPKIQLSLYQMSVPTFTGNSWLMDVGAEEFLSARLNNSFPLVKDLTLDVAAAGTTPEDPNDNATYGSYDIAEDSINGQVIFTLETGNWVIDTTGTYVKATYPTVSFGFTGPITADPYGISGYYVRDYDDNVLWCVAEALLYYPDDTDTLYINPIVAFFSYPPKVDIYA